MPCGLFHDFEFSDTIGPKNDENDTTWDTDKFVRICGVTIGFIAGIPKTLILKKIINNISQIVRILYDAHSI